MHKFKVSGQSVPKIECKQTEGRTDRRTDGGDCIISHANAVGKNTDVICEFAASAIMQSNDVRTLS